MSGQDDNLAAFRDLRTVFAEEAPLALVGAGLAMRNGYPSWQGLLARFHDELVRRGTIPAGSVERFERLDSLFRASLYRQQLGEADYRNLLQQIFAPSATQHATIRTFVDLPFSHFLTTNYDPSLERACRQSAAAVDSFSWSENCRLREWITSLAGAGRGRPCVVHLHGVWDQPGEVVLCDEDYLDRYVRSEDANRLLFAVFAIKRVVLVGFGMQDPDLMQLLRTVTASLRDHAGRHFALMPLTPEQDPDLMRALLRRRFGVQPVFYPSSRTHGALDDLIAALASGEESRLADISRIPFSGAGAQSAPEGASAPSAGAAPTGEAAAAAGSSTGPSTHARSRRQGDAGHSLPATHPDDPQKGRWGGSPATKTRKLAATVRQRGPSWFQITITLKARAGSDDLPSDIVFHLHDTFLPDRVMPDKITARAARLDVQAWGAFTVGCEIPSEGTRLEYDLAEIPRAPPQFVAS